MERSLNPAADRGRMFVALGVLVVLGLLSWFTIDPTPSTTPAEDFVRAIVRSMERVSALLEAMGCGVSRQSIKGTGGRVVNGSRL
jgi:hypothetical protein